MNAEPEPAREDVALLTAFLAERDVPCPRCGYNLHGLTNGRCPECGDYLRLQVRSAEPRLGAFITLVLVSGIGLGGSTLFGVLATVHAPRNWWFGERCGIILLIQWGLSGLLTLLALLLRRRLRKLGRGIQWSVAIATLLLLATLSTAIVVTFR